jgi:hypothetical protein
MMNISKSRSSVRNLDHLSAHPLLTCWEGNFNIVAALEAPAINRNLNLEFVTVKWENEWRVQITELKPFECKFERDLGRKFSFRALNKALYSLYEESAKMVGEKLGGTVFSDCPQ